MSTSDCTTEMWLPVVGYEGLYEVSDHGQVRSINRRGQFLHPSPNSRGYPRLSLSNGKTTKTCKVHRLVMAAFVGPCPDGFEVAHNNGVRTDNRFGNLRYDTHAKNIADKKAHGATGTKMAEQDVREVFRLKDAGVHRKVIAEQFGVSPAHIDGILRGRSWSHLGLGVHLRAKTLRPRLTPAQISLIHKLAFTGITQTAIAVQVGTTPFTVSDVILGKSHRALHPMMAHRN